MKWAVQNIYKNICSPYKVCELHWIHNFSKIRQRRASFRGVLLIFCHNFIYGTYINFVVRYQRIVTFWYKQRHNIWGAKREVGKSEWSSVKDADDSKNEHNLNDSSQTVRDVCTSINCVTLNIVMLVARPISCSLLTRINVELKRAYTSLRGVSCFCLTLTWGSSNLLQRFMEELLHLGMFTKNLYDRRWSLCDPLHPSWWYK